MPETEIRSGGRHILVRVDNVVADMSDKSPWQFVLETENPRRIATLLQRGGWALHVRPHLDRIQSTPTNCQVGLQFVEPGSLSKTSRESHSKVGTPFFGRTTASQRNRFRMPRPGGRRW